MHTYTTYKHAQTEWWSRCQKTFAPCLVPKIIITLILGKQRQSEVRYGEGSGEVPILGLSGLSYRRVSTRRSRQFHFVVSGSLNYFSNKRRNTKRDRTKCAQTVLSATDPFCLLMTWQWPQHQFTPCPHRSEQSVKVAAMNGSLKNEILARMSAPYCANHCLLNVGLLVGCSRVVHTCNSYTTASDSVHQPMHLWIKASEGTSWSFP